MISAQAKGREHTGRIETWRLAGELDCEVASGADRVRLRSLDGGPLELTGPGTHFGFALAGECRLERAGAAFPLEPGMFFCVPSEARLSGTGSAFVLSADGFDGSFLLGGPIESRGRLRYIDGCTDSLLLAPPRRGDPCLNSLHFPDGTRQTPHTHPSLRVGVVASGSGTCLDAEGRALPLETGVAFAIPAHARHGFLTGSEPMVVVAYHPDSDFGPTDRDHPMLNRTWVGGAALGGSDREAGLRPSAPPRR